jgi:ubiquitin carboxyl-terminal hydrolase 36/42
MNITSIRRDRYYQSRRLDIDNCWKAILPKGIGFIGYRNNCFLNASLQCLVYTPAIVNHKEQLLVFESDNKFSLPIQFVCLLMNCTSSRRSPISTQLFVEHLKEIGSDFTVGREEDAQSFTLQFLSRIAETIDKLKGPGCYNPIYRIFEGTIRHRTICLSCNNVIDTFEKAIDLELGLTNCKTVDQALHRYTQPELLDGDNKYYCSKCKSYQIAQKSISIHDVPPVLILQLKRFTVNSLYNPVKICDKIQYRNTLDLSRFVSETSFVPVDYELHAVLVHSGVSCSSGHYYCFVKAPNGKWLKIDNATVQLMREGFHLKQEAYMLYYSRKSSSMKKKQIL